MKIVPQKVEYVNHMGSDISVVNAARVSFGKSIVSFEPRDAKLIRYLATHNHWTPFAHTALSIRIKCPIFVARQLGKHQVGLVWNEVSRRYVDDEPEFYFPSEWRGKPVNAKQGSSEVVIDKIWWIPEDSWYNVSDGVKESCQVALGRYKRMIECGVAPEQARMVLPQNTMTEFIWTGNVASFARVVNLRLDPHTQQETREIANGIHTIMELYFPESTRALVQHND